MAVSVDDLEQSRALVERLGLSFPLGLDEDRTLTKAFGVYDPANDIAWPALFLIGPDGVVRWRSLAETYTVRPASQMILDAADGLGASAPKPAAGPSK